MERGGKKKRWRGAVETMVSEGAYMIDIGAVSTRPGAPDVNSDEEKNRLLPVLSEIRRSYPDLIISVDTYRSEIARLAVSEGADMINDISAGNIDPEMIPFIGSAGIPYIMMHMQEPLETRVEGEWWAEMEEVFHTD